MKIKEIKKVTLFETINLHQKTFTKKTNSTMNHRPQGFSYVCIVFEYKTH